MSYTTHLLPGLRAAREDRGWTLQKLAQRTGLSISHLSMIELGHRRASFPAIAVLTRVLGCDGDALMKSSDDGSEVAVRMDVAGAPTS